MDYKDYYQIMGLEPQASADEVKRSYRKLARKYHPDVSKEKDAEEKFKEVVQAYEVLKDPKKRSQYDQYKEQWKQQQDFNQRAQQDTQQSSSQKSTADDADADFESILNELFKQRQQQSHAYDTGQDIHAKLAIELEDSYHGNEKAFQLQVPVVENNQVNYQTKTIQVKIPQGIKNGQQIRLKGQGTQFANNNHGDLYLEISINPHAWFQLVDSNIELKLPITPWESALGESISVPTLGGEVKLTIPPNSQTGSRLRLKGRGLPGNKPGDQFVTLQIVIPPKTNPSMEKLYQDMAQTSDYNPRQALGVTHA